MKVYVLSPEGIAREKRKGLVRSIAIFIFALSLGLGVPAIAVSASLWFIVSMIPLLALIFYFGLRRGFKILEENWSSYQLLVSSDSIVRKQVRLPDLEIHRDQVTKLQERPGTGLFIRTQEKRLSIYVPASIEGYDELRDILSQWGDPSLISPASSFNTILQVLAIISFGAGFAIMVLSKNIALVITSGIFLILYMLCSSIYLRQRKDIDPRAKISIWQIFLVVLVFALMLYVKVNYLLTK
jgi:hypothetical protein